MKNIFLPLFILLSLTFYSQENKIDIFPRENVNLILNKNIYVVGETVFYKSYIFNTEQNTPSIISKMNYVFLVNPEKDVVSNQKINIRDGQANGDLFLPSKLKTGNYKLVSITLNSENNKIIDSGIEDLYIINPFLNETYVVANKETINIEKDTNFIFNKPILNTYNKRQKVIFNLPKFNDLNQNNLIVNIQKIDSLLPVKEVKTVVKNQTNLVPEVRGELIYGKWLNKDNTPVSNKLLTLSMSNNPTIFKNVQSNKEGDFYFSVNENYKKGKLILNSQKINLIDSTEIILNKKELTFKDQLTFKNLKLSKNIFNWLKNRSIQTQIENIYFENKKDSIITFDTPKIFYSGYATRYKLSEYDRFITVKETFTEIISKAYERKKKGKHQFYIYFSKGLGEFASKFELLLLIDGIQILDHQKLYDYDPYQMDYIDVVDKLYFYGPKVYGGVISVRTTKGNYQPKSNEVLFMKDFNMPIANKIYFQPNYEKDYEKLKQIPDFRAQLYWNPNVSSKQRDITFFTSDIEGIFQIKIEGYNDNGEYFSEIKYIRVK